MEKSIEQLLELSKNPYFTMSEDERKRLDDFLSKKSAQQNQPKNSGDSSEKNIPATVINKNKVNKETGQIPTVDNVASKQNDTLEQAEYEKTSEALAEGPAKVNDPTEAA